MNAYQKAKLERSLTLLRYLLSLATEMREHCTKHVRETHTVCTKQLIERMVSGRLLYVEKQERTNVEPDYFIAPFEEVLADLIADLESELKLLGGADAA